MKIIPYDFDFPSFTSDLSTFNFSFEFLPLEWIQFSLRIEHERVDKEVFLVLEIRHPKNWSPLIDLLKLIDFIRLALPWIFSFDVFKCNEWSFWIVSHLFRRREHISSEWEKHIFDKFHSWNISSWESSTDENFALRINEKNCTIVPSFLHIFADEKRNFKPKILDQSIDTSSSSVFRWSTLKNVLFFLKMIQNQIWMRRTNLFVWPCAKANLFSDISNRIDLLRNMLHYQWTIKENSKWIDCGSCWHNSTFERSNRGYG